MVLLAMVDLLAFKCFWHQLATVLTFGFIRSTFSLNEGVKDEY